MLPAASADECGLIAYGDAIAGVNGDVTPLLIRDEYLVHVLSRSANHAGDIALGKANRNVHSAVGDFGESFFRDSALRPTFVRTA